MAFTTYAQMAHGSDLTEIPSESTIPISPNDSNDTEHTTGY